MQADKLRQLLDIARACGACGAAALPASRVALDGSFRQICISNACGRYNRCHMCPPELGDIDLLMARIRSHEHAVIYQSIAPLEDSFDFEGMMAAGQAHSRMRAEIHLRAKGVLQGEFLHLSCGCRLCAQCAKEDAQPCRYPEIALGAVEGWGVDVYQTVRNTPLNYINGANTVTYFGLILFTE